MSRDTELGRRTLPEAVDASELFERGPPRPVLVVLAGPQLGQRIVLEAPADLGRDPECDLVLTDELVEWRHARVEPTPEGWLVVGLGQARPVELNGAPVERALLRPDDQLRVGRSVVRFELHDDVELAYDAAVLERLFTDELTGLMARRRFDSQLRAAADAALRDGETLALLSADLDGLKQVNDRHGHPAGARLIAGVGQAILQALPPEAFACRLGGDEFAIAWPRQSLDDGGRLALRVNGLVRELAVQHQGHALSVRVSLGVACLPAHGRSAQALLRAADGALYQAKRAGGDRVWCADAGGPGAREPDP